MKEAKIAELFTGKLLRLPDGGIVIAKISKLGKYYTYVLYPQRGVRTRRQRAHTKLFMEARERCDWMLKDEDARFMWEIRYGATGGVYKGKRYNTLRGFVFAACYDEVEKSMKKKLA